MLWFKDLISILYPELLVLSAIVIAVFLSTSKYKDIIWITSTLLMFTGCVHIIKNQLNITEPVQILSGMFIADNLSVVFRLLILTTAILLILGSVKYTNGFIHKSEFMIILLSAVLGSLFLVGANDLITLFIALETLGLSSILLAGYSKYDLRSNEASIKYLLNSASASAIFLFGLSILYGITGATQFQEIKYKLLQLSGDGNLNSSIIVVLLILIVAGLGFKLASAPFHMWSPDVYDGAPTPATAFLSVISKASGFAISLRLIITLFDFTSNLWQPMIITISVLSMIIGNFVALGEAINKSSIKRLMAYSSIAQIGYILIGLALFRTETITSSIFYLIIYSIMNLGAFLCIIAFGNEANSDSISDYSGLSQKRPLLAFAFSVCLFNLAGLPIPPAGFIAKFILFKSSFDCGFAGIVLGSIALITTILSIYYYSLIVKLMIVDKPSNAVLNMDSNKESLGKSNELNSAILISVIAIFIITAYSNPLLKIAGKTTSSISTKNQLISKGFN
ncbi:MAG: NADH-quinone oxidoreductase subunit NuoN [Candidatus Melainabacteria bacterium]|nr:NADH-quinone oxidoreductase subunit NuoN [Candidatus Melainabacteria bacterium]